MSSGRRPSRSRATGSRAVQDGGGEPAIVAASEQVVASTRSETYAFIRAHYDRTVAVEMEGRGFLNALRANQKVGALVVRGISTCSTRRT